MTLIHSLCVLASRDFWMIPLICCCKDFHVITSSAVQLKNVWVLVDHDYISSLVEFACSPKQKWGYLKTIGVFWIILLAWECLLSHLRQKANCEDLGSTRCTCKYCYIWKMLVGWSIKIDFKLMKRDYHLVFCFCLLTFFLLSQTALHTTHRTTFLYSKVLYHVAIYSLTLGGSMIP